ncbi:MAG: hypothetical protein HY470_00840 [Candidatus Ryanbacteria bacterium]|nr:hypothetical protein [Candidatus Ryanbacteria bacterium]
MRGAFLTKTLTLILAGFGFVAALAWNDAIQTLVKQVFGETSGGVIAKFIYAFLVTGLLAVVSIKIGREEKK